MKQQCFAWFVAVDTIDGKVTRQAVYIVAAFTERSARRQARAAHGKQGTITRVGPIDYAHAWRAEMY